MVKPLVRFVAGLLLCVPALLLLGVGAGAIFDAVKYHVLPVVLHVAASEKGRAMVYIEKAKSLL